MQGLIAARIDALPAAEKALLQDASVLGKVFWLGGAAALTAAEPLEAEERLHALERKEFVRRERRSSVGGEAEFAFRHLLVRDIAYGQIPRAARADKHLRAAAWIESLGRHEDHAETVAHHYVKALEFSRAAGNASAEVSAAARTALSDAGERSFALNAFGHAAHLYGQSLDLVPAGDPGRSELLFRRAQALHLAADERQFAALAAARDALLEAGVRDRAAAAQALLARGYWFRGTWDGARTGFDAAEGLLAGAPPTLAKAQALAGIAGFRLLDGQYQDAIRIGVEALAVADRLGLEEVRAAVLVTVGGARLELGDDAGGDDLEESRRVALRAGTFVEAFRACNNLAVALYAVGDLDRAFSLLEEGHGFAERAGHVDQLRFSRGMLLLPPLDRGEWDESIRQADAFIAECETGGGHTLQASAHCHRGSIRLARDDMAGAIADAERALELAREVRQADRMFQSLAFAVRASAETGELERAREHASEFDFLALDDRRPPPAWAYVHFCWVAAGVGLAEELDALLARQKRSSGWVAAARAAVRGDYPEAAEQFARMGTRPHEAYAHLRTAETLVADGRRTEAELHLGQALAFFRRVKATRYIRAAEGLLAEPTRSHGG